jgi:CheY-like chemotaxis protein
METILVVEDNIALRENTAEILELARYNVVQASNGKEAHQQVLKFNPDVIACDIIMPELDGHGFLKLLRSENTTNHIPVVFFSIDHIPDFLKKEASENKIIYLIKPFSNEDLIGAIKTCINRAKKK